MKKRVAEWLVCPQCGSRLHCETSQTDDNLPWEEIITGNFSCVGCEQSYPIEGGIPRMLAGTLDEDVNATVEGFGWEWNTFNLDIRESFMADRVHFLDFIHPTNATDFRDKWVLDAGCGMGRFTRVGAEFGSHEIIGVDLSRAVEAAYINTRTLPNTHIIQADIFALPFGIGFDTIFSIGVLHHLSDPRGGFSCLTHQLKPGGKIVVWVYSEENNRWVTSIISPIRQHVTSRLPRRVLLTVSEIIGAFLFLLLRGVYMPARRNPLGLDLSHLLPYRVYMNYTSRLSYPELTNVVFDHLVPKLTEYISRAEIEDWFREEQLADVLISSRNNMSWRGHGTRVLSPNTTRMLNP